MWSHRWDIDKLLKKLQEWVPKVLEVLAKLVEKCRPTTITVGVTHLVPTVTVSWTKAH